MLILPALAPMSKARRLKKLQMMLKKARVSSSSECRSTFFIKIAETGYTFNPVYYLTSKPLLSYQDLPSTSPNPSSPAQPMSWLPPQLIGCLLVKRQVDIMQLPAKI